MTKLRKGTPRLRKGLLTEVTKRNTGRGYEKEHRGYEVKGTMSEVTKRNTGRGYEKEHRGYEKKRRVYEKEY